MTREDILRMAREAGMTTMAHDSRIERFATLIAAAEREKLAHWMRSLGYATGQGKTTEDLLDFLGVGIAEGLEAETLMEREACAKVCDAAAKKMDDEGEGPTGYIAWVTDCAAAIRARGNK